VIGLLALILLTSVLIFIIVSFQAVKKGLSSTMVGAIIGIFELTVVLVAPVYGKYVLFVFIVVVVVFFSFGSCTQPKL